MGTLRTLLALAVVFGHSYGFVFTGGMLAVQIFYIISGYLISLILLNNNSYKNLFNFYANRALRLFPIYWAVACISLIIYAFFYFVEQDEFFNVINNAKSGKFLLIFSNIFLIGQDWIMFSGIFDGAFQFTSNFRDSEILLWKGLLVPQAWTLGLEISFYLLAPFILYDKRKWIVIFISALLLKIYLQYIDLGNQDPFSYRFFPAELSLFLLGVFSHQLLEPIYRKHNLIEKKYLINIVTCTITSYVFLFHIFPVSYPILSITLILSVFFALPFLARFQKNSNLDQWIGNLSYPIYICHWIVIELIAYIFQESTFYESIEYFVLIIVSTLFFAFLLETQIGKRVELHRAKNRGF